MSVKKSSKDIESVAGKFFSLYQYISLILVLTGLASLKVAHAQGLEVSLLQ